MPAFRARHPAARTADPWSCDPGMLGSPAPAGFRGRPRRGAPRSPGCSSLRYPRIPRARARAGARRTPRRAGRPAPSACDCGVVVARGLERPHAAVESAGADGERTCIVQRARELSARRSPPGTGSAVRPACDSAAGVVAASWRARCATRRHRSRYRRRSACAAGKMPAHAGGANPFLAHDAIASICLGFIEQALAPARRRSRRRGSSDRARRAPASGRTATSRCTESAARAGSPPEALDAQPLRRRRAIARSSPSSDRARVLRRSGAAVQGLSFRVLYADLRVSRRAPSRDRRRAPRAKAGSAPPARFATRPARRRRARNSPGAIFTAVCTREVVAPPISSGSVKPCALHLARDVRHLLERRRDQARQADDVGVLARARSRGSSAPAPSRRG